MMGRGGRIGLALAMVVTCWAVSPVGASADGLYQKKVGGHLWLEATTGPVKFHMTKYKSLGGELGNMLPTEIKRGKEFGGALGVLLGPMALSARVKTANLEDIKFNTVALNFDFLIRAVPYVHPYIRFALNYHWMKNNYTGISTFEKNLAQKKVFGAGTTLGLGIRVPLIKYLSLGLGVDLSPTLIIVRGKNQFDNEDEVTGTFGLVTGGSIALTFHL